MSVAADENRRPVVRRAVARSRDEAGGVLKAIYGPSVHNSFDSEAGGFKLQFTVVAVGDIRLVRADVADFNCTRSSGDVVQIFLPQKGQLLQQVGARQTVAERGTGIVVRPDEQTKLSTALGAAFVLSLPVESLSMRAELLTGKPLKGNLHDTFAEVIDLASPLSAALSRNMLSAMSEILALENIGASFLAQTAYEDLLVNLAIPVLFPAIEALIYSPQCDCGPAVLYKARDYIVEHALDPIELSQLAASLGISMRTMQVQFQKRFGYSPRDFIIECRLEHARKMLLSPDCNSSVTVIAFSSGFTNLGHFAAKYRDKFGELPSDTRRRPQSGHTPWGTTRWLQTSSTAPLYKIWQHGQTTAADA